MPYLSLSHIEQGSWTRFARIPLIGCSDTVLHEACRFALERFFPIIQRSRPEIHEFYMTPGSCSTGIHIILEELDEIFEVYIVNLPAGDHFKPDYVTVNPKSTIRRWYARMAAR